MVFFLWRGQFKTVPCVCTPLEKNQSKLPQVSARPIEASSIFISQSPFMGTELCDSLEYLRLIRKFQHLLQDSWGKNCCTLLTFNHSVKCPTGLQGWRIIVGTWGCSWFFKSWNLYRTKTIMSWNVRAYSLLDWLWQCQVDIMIINI